MKFINQSLGVDLSNSKFDCCMSVANEAGVIKKLGAKKFSNDLSGFKSLFDWIASKLVPGVRFKVVMEATGVFSENLAYYLIENSPYSISVMLPMRAKYYFKSLEIKTKTDKVDAQMLSQLGLERNVPDWKPVSYKLRTLKLLSR